MEPDIEAQKGNRGHFLPSLLIKAAVAVGLAAIFLVSPPTTRDAAGWDAILGEAFSSHEGITERAIDSILKDPTADEGLKEWLRPWQDTIVDYAGSAHNPFIYGRYGELIHGIRRPGDSLQLDCEPPPSFDAYSMALGPARWAVGNNPGTTHPEYWWQTVVCAYRRGDDNAYRVLGQLIHAVQDQGSLPHAYYHQHGAESHAEGFEILSALSHIDTSSYQTPNKNLIEEATHDNEVSAEWPIAVRASNWVEIDLAPHDPNTTATNLGVPAPKTLAIQLSVINLIGAPVISLEVEYSKLEIDPATGEEREVAAVQTFENVPLNGLSWQTLTISDNFAANGTIRAWYKRTEGCWFGDTWCLQTSTGQIRIYVTETQDVLGGGEIVKPQLAHPWEYYDWLREWTWWATAAPYWRRYYYAAGVEGSLGFTWMETPFTELVNAELAMLSLQWRVSVQVTRWVLEDAWERLVKEPSYSTEDAGGDGYRVTLYKDAYFNSSLANSPQSPEYNKSIAVACESYSGDEPGRSSTCGAFVPAPARSGPEHARAIFGDGIFAACGTGGQVIMKANDLGEEFMSKVVSSLEVRGATVYLYPGKNLGGTPLVVTGDTPDLGAFSFSDLAQSVRIVPPIVNDPPVAIDDSVSMPVNSDNTYWLPIYVLDNDVGGTVDRDQSRRIVDVTEPVNGGLAGINYADGTIKYQPRWGWRGTDTFSYEINDADGYCDWATVTVTVGVDNQPPTDVVFGSESYQAEEGRPFSVAGGFLDSDVSDTHTVVLDWGDGTSPTEIALPAGELSFTADHIYIDNNPPGTPTYTVTAVVTDPAGASADGSTSVVVVNVPPELANLAAGPFYEASAGTLSGTIVDPGMLDSFVMTVDWADGTAVQSIPYPAGTTNFSLQHTYADDNPTGTPSDTYAISMTVTDKDGGMGSASVPAVVNNVPPVVSIDSVRQAGMEIGVDVDIALTNTAVEVAGSFTDVGAQDTHTASIDWGDGHIDALGPVTGSLSAAHTYATPCNCTVTLTVTDDDTGVGTATRGIEVVDAAGAIVHVSEDLAAFSSNWSVLRALGRLDGEVGGLAADGAVDLLEDNPVAALYMVKLALWYLEAAEGGDPSLNFAKQEALLALAARSEAIDVIENAEAIAFKPSDLRKISEATTLLARGDGLRSASDYVNAVNKYWLAVRSVVGIR